MTTFYTQEIHIIRSAGEIPAQLQPAPSLGCNPSDWEGVRTEARLIVNALETVAQEGGQVARDVNSMIDKLRFTEESEFFYYLNEEFFFILRDLIAIRAIEVSK